MKNNKGQGAAIFIIIIPLIALALAFIYDNARMIAEEKRYKEVSKQVLTDTLSNSYTNYKETIKDLFEKNKYEVEFLDVEVTETEPVVITLYNSHTYESFFGRLLGVKSYRTEVRLSATKINDEVEITELEIEE